MVCVATCATSTRNAIYGPTSVDVARSGPRADEKYCKITKQPRRLLDFHSNGFAQNAGKTYARTHGNVRPSYSTGLELRMNWFMMAYYYNILLRCLLARNGSENHERIL